jgi:hypothetical protein
VADTNQQLQQAYEAIKAGRRQEAIGILRPFLRANPDHANAWWLLANAEREPEAIREALDNVLRLRPDNDKAQQMLAKLEARYPRKPKPPVDEFDFGAEDDLFGDEEYDPHYKPKNSSRAASATPGRVTVVKSGNSNSTALILLAVVGVIAVVACGACFALPTLGITLFGQQMSQVVNDPTFVAALQEMADNVTMMSVDNTTLGEYVSRGTIQRGQTMQGNVDTFDDDGWVYNADGGEQLTIEVTARGDLDPQLYIFRPDGTLLAGNDDIDFMDNTNSRVQVTLPTSGPFVIVVSAFGTGGEYDLAVR